MEEPEEFDARIATVHSAKGAGADMDIRHEEFMAMAQSFLGPDYDPSKLQEVEALQIRLQRKQAFLVELLDAGNMSPQAYVQAVNKLHLSVAEACEEVLGPADFHKLFGMHAADMHAHLDEKAFMESMAH